MPKGLSFYLFAICLLTGCQRPLLLVENEWISERSLASHWVQTPDPQRYCPPTGRQLIVSWSIPKAYLAMREPHIELTVRLGDNEEDFLTVPVKTIRGRAIYSLLNDKYWDHGGIQTYLAQLIVDDCVIEEWRHALWAELIIINAEESDSS